MSLDSPIISNNYVDPAHFLSLRNRYQVLSNFLLCCGIGSLTSQVNNQITRPLGDSSFDFTKSHATVDLGKAKAEGEMVVGTLMWNWKRENLLFAYMF